MDKFRNKRRRGAKRAVLIFVLLPCISIVIGYLLTSFFLAGLFRS